MSQSYSVQAVLTSVDKNMSKGFLDASSNAQSMGGKISSTTKSIGKSMQVVGGAITAFGAGAIKTYGDVSSNINKAAVVAGSSNKNLSGNMKSLTGVAVKMGKELPISIKDASGAMVEMARQGASVGDIKKEFPPIARAASATGEDLTGVATTVQQAMNIWGGSSKDATKDSATMAIVANKSSASIGDMQQVFANVGTAAKNMGFSLQDVSVATGVMTNAGIPAAQASMDLNHAFTQMVKPSKTAADTMKKLGISYTDAQGNMKPMRQILGEVAKATDGMSESEYNATLNNLYGTAGAKAMMPLLNSVTKGAHKSGQGWDDMSAAVDKGAGTYGKANKYLKDNAQNMTHNVGDAVDQMKDSWQGLVIVSMGQSAPIIQKIANTFANLASKIESGNSPMDKFIRAFVGLSPVIGPAVIAVGTFLTQVNNIGKSMKGFGKLLASPWGLALSAIALVGGGLVVAYNKIKPFHDAVNNVGKVFTKAFGGVAKDAINALKGLLAGLKDDFKQIGQAIQDQVGGKLKNVNFQDFASKASMAIQNVIAFIGQLLEAVTNVIKGFIKVGAVQAVWNALKNVFKAVMDVIKAVAKPIQTVVEKLNHGGDSKNGWEQVGEAIGKIVKWVANRISDIARFISALMKIKGVGPVLSAVLTGFMAFKTVKKIYIFLSKGVFTVIGAVTRLFGVVQKVITFVKGIGAVLSAANPATLIITAIAAVIAALVYFFTKTKTGQKLWSEFTTFLSNTWQSIKDTAVSIWHGIGDFLTTTWTGIKDTASSIWTGIKNFFSGLWTGIKNTAVNVWTTLKGWLSNTWNAIKGVASAIWNPIKSFFNGLWTGIKNTAVNVWTTLKGWLSNTWNAIKGVATSIWNPIKSFFSGLWNGIKNTAVKVWSTLKGWLSNTWNAIKSAASSIWTPLKKFFSGLWNGIKNTAVKVWSTLKGWLKNTWSAIKGIASSIWNPLKKFFSNLWNGIKNVTKKAWNGLKSWLGNIWNSIKRGASKIWSGIVDVAKNVVNRVKKAFSFIKDIDLGKAGHAIMTSLYNGLVKAWGKVKDFVGGIANWIKKHKGPISYDKGLLIPAGNAIMDGFNAGLMDSFKDVKRNISSMTGAISSTADDAISDSVQALNSNISDGSMTNNITGQLSVQQQPAYVNLDLGGSDYTAFVDDISHKQGQRASLKHSYRM